MEKLEPKTIAELYQECDLELVKAQDRYKERTAQLRKQCKHEWHYNSDPSGNNDSDYTCWACQSWVKRLPKDE